MRNLRRSTRGQFSVIAALLVSVILIMSVISMYSMVRYAPLQDSPKVLSGIGEMNNDLKRILDFTVGYYGSVLQVTGNYEYAQKLTTDYLSSGLVNIARSHPEWNPSFELDFEDISTCWFMPYSYSMGSINITYSLSALGIEGVTYHTSSALSVEMLPSSDPNTAIINVTRDNSEPELGLSQENFRFYKYNDNLTWELVNPANVLISNGLYYITIPEDVNQDAYSVQVEDNRGLIVPAFYSQDSVVSGIPHYTYSFDWESTGVLDIYTSLNTDTFGIELLQNGTLKWLGQPLELTSNEQPIPPVCIKAFRVNATVDGNNQEVPFQVEDWASEYTVPLGLAGNDSIFSNTNMFVFLVNNRISEVTVWWDGNDTAIQTPYAWRNLYFKDDVTNPSLSHGLLNNSRIELNIPKSGNLIVNSRVVGDLTIYTTDFLRVNNDSPDCGSGPAFVIYNGVVRDIVQHEPEYQNGVNNCPNFYAQVYVTFPANATYYTYAVRTIFVNSNQSRTITDLSAIQISNLSGTRLTEDGTSGGYPVSSNSMGCFYDGSPTGWDHHWSEFISISGTSGAGVMFTDDANEKLYIFDGAQKSGALNVQSSSIEVNPVDSSLNSVSFQTSKDITWHGAVVTFSGEPIYPTSGNTGLWVMVEHPPVVSIDEYEEEEPSPPEPTIEFYAEQTSDVDSSPDKGSHSDFSAQQDGQNLNFDTLTEAYTGSGGIQDYVDNNISDVDSSVDIGSQSNFAAQQDGPDSVYDTLTEANTGSSSDVTLINAESFEGTLPPSGWSKTGDWYKTSSQHYSGIYSAGIDGTSSGASGNLVTSNLDCSDATSIFVDFRFYDDGLDANELLLEYFDGTSWNTIADLGTYSERTWNNHYQQEITDSQYFVSDFKIRWRATNVGVDGWWFWSTTEHAYVDAVTVTKEVSHINYELDQEVQFTGVVDFLPDHELCIYAGALGTEDLRVDYRSGSNWVNLATDLNANSWNNFTVSVTSTFTVRFSGGTETGDASADQWEIDAVLLNSHGNVSNEDAVDNNTSDVDSSADKGDHSSFSSQQSGPDSVYDTLTEENTSGSGDFTLLDDGFESYDWDTNWDAILSDWREDNSPVHSGSSSAWASDYHDGDFTSDNLDTSDAGSIFVDFWFMKDDIEYGDFVLYYYDGSDYVQIDDLYNNGGDDNWLRFTATITDSRYFVPNFRIRFDAGMDNSYENVWVDDVVITKEVQSNDNYELDLEVQWTDVPYTLPNEYLSIYGGNMGAEDVAVDIWTGAVWETVFTDLSSGWNNVSISEWLTGSDFIIRFRDGTETGDASADTWQIDVALIHVWNEDENYELDLEVQWTSVDFDESNEELCIYVGETGGENLRVDVWTGSAWETVFSDLAVGWNNATVSSYLTSSTFTIRFAGETETGDTIQDYWTIDATLIRSWT